MVDLIKLGEIIEYEINGGLFCMNEILDLNVHFLEN
jgi:hypothetical protein